MDITPPYSPISMPSPKTSARAAPRPKASAAAPPTARLSSPAWVLSPCLRPIPLPAQSSFRTCWPPFFTWWPSPSTRWGARHRRLSGLICLGTLVSELFELGFKDNFLRRMAPDGASQNVHAVVEPAGEHRQDLVLIGHIDTQRTPLIFRTPRW